MAVLVGVIGALHLIAIRLPANSKVFDEAYYVPAANDILNGVASNPEHPFLGKAWVSLGILVFGDGWLGWRITPVIFSILSLVAFYYLSRRFFNSNLSLYATALLGLELIFFVHGSLALLEVSSIFFAFLSYLLYFKRRFWWSAVMMGLSLLSKETAAFFILVLMFFHIFRVKYKAYRELLPKFYRGVAFLLIVGVVFLIPVTVYDQIYKPASSVQVLVSVNEVQLKDERGVVTSVTTITNTTTSRVIIPDGIQHFIYILGYASSLPITPESKVDAGNYAWNWVVPIPNLYPPMPYYVESMDVPRTVTQNNVSSVVIEKVVGPVAWYGVGSLPLWWSIWLLTPFLLYNVFKRRGGPFDTFLLTWIGGTYLPMLYISGVVGRIVYPFYFIQTVPALALGLPYMFDHLFKGRIPRIVIFTLFLAVHIYIFTYYFPLRDISKILPV